ncbi:MAG: universal stress protein [Sulfuricella denitrificans]|nr:universal stress protein [Sulfuricella denitrificans]
MTTYQRILVSISAGGQSDVLLHRAAELAQSQRIQMLVVQVIDTRSGFESEGPAGILPGESAARRIPDAIKRLDLLLARNNLSWAEAKVVRGEPKVALAEVIRAWKPDVVVTCDSHLLHGIEQDADILTVSRQSLFRRLTRYWRQPTLQHA